MEWILALAAISLLAAWIKIATRQHKSDLEAFKARVAPNVVCEWCGRAPATFTIMNVFLDPDSGQIFRVPYMEVCGECGLENERLNAKYPVETKDGD